MKIQVLGSGCKKCKELYERTQKAADSFGADFSVEYITDIQKIVEMGVMSSPVLAINGKPVIAGTLPEVEKIKQIISEHISDNLDKKENNKSCGSCSCSCSCGGKC
ncbi:MAG: thioredoxin family protein [Candidatus Paceibacterota bacterium]